MARGKSKNAKTFEKILMVLVNGGVITKEQIEATIGYKHMYRISTELWKIKTRGGVIKTIKDGRKTVGYELINVDEMMKLLSDRDFTPQTIVAPAASTKKKSGTKKLEKLEDLETSEVQKSEEVVDDVEVIEVTEKQ